MTIRTILTLAFALLAGCASAPPSPEEQQATEVLEFIDRTMSATWFLR